jgi:epoxyqueuosine reductase QueG
MIRSAEIKARALEIGFDLCGIAPAADFPELRRLRDWIDCGYGGEMSYMARTASRRASWICGSGQTVSSPRSSRMGR